MKLSVTGRLYAGFILAFIVSAVVGIITYFTFRNQVAESKWVNHTYRVINQTENIQKLMVDLETSRRGFRSTNQKRFLAPFYKAAKNTKPELEKLEDLVRDNPHQLKRVEKLSVYINELIGYWRGLGEDADIFTRADLIRITDQEKDQTDRIRRSLEEIITEENRLLIARQNATNAAIRTVTYEVIIGTLLVQLIIVLMIRTIIAEFNKRRRAENILKENNIKLVALNRETNGRNWMLQGIGKVGESLQGVHNLHTLADRALKAILDYLGLPAGAFYFYNEEGKKLDQVAAVAVFGADKKEYAIGEGLVGKAAMQADIIHSRDIPPGQWLISGPAGTSRPRELMLVPLSFNSVINGVIELASPGAFPEASVELLKNVAVNIGIAVNASDARERVMSLLRRVQQQNEELETQQEELRQTNEELTRQAESLQVSEEELRVQEEELRQINAELEEKNEAVEIARQALAVKAHELEVTGRYKSEFLANMSHELRTPLNSVLILAKLLADNKPGTLNEKQVEYAGIIHKSGSDLLKLINDILDLAKIESGKVDFHMEQVPVGKIAEDARQLWQIQAEEKGLRFETVVPEDLPEHILTDKTRLEQIIRNLLSNAFRFTPSGGSVSLRFRLAEDAPFGGGPFIAIEVEDSGIGIPADKQQIIFEAFQQADGSTSRKYGGTGLGLSISRQLIRHLGGVVTLQSEEGRGSLFTVYLPVSGETRPGRRKQKPAAGEKELALPEKGIKEQDKVADDRGSLNNGDKLMLIIEDDEQFAEIVRDVARDKGYKTLVALQGDEGLYYAMKYKPSAIILDLMLPVMDGSSVLKMLKGNDKLKHIPVHVISAIENRKQDIPGAIAFLRKPVTHADLEKAFTLIGSHVASSNKQVLVLAGAAIKDDTIRKMSEGRQVEMDCDFAPDENTALKLLDSKKYDCIIADIGRDIAQGIALLKNLQTEIRRNGVPVIIYLDKDLSQKDEMQLRKISNTIIRESSLSEDRLMDELELFLYKIQETGGQELPRRTEDIDNDRILQGKRILLVDDDMRNVFALSTLLEQEQMHVVTANDGREALEQLKLNGRFDLVLMDIMMPEMDGYEAMKRIRRDLLLDRLPIIALTAKAMPGDQEKCIEAGASDYITKPVDSHKLFSLMKVWLSQ